MRELSACLVSQFVCVEYGWERSTDTQADGEGDTNPPMRP